MHVVSHLLSTICYSQGFKCWINLSQIKIYYSELRVDLFTVAMHKGLNKIKFLRQVQLCQGNLNWRQGNVREFCFVQSVWTLPCEYTHMYPNRYTRYICIAFMICTSLQDYHILYPLIQRKSILQTSLVIILTHARTHAIVKVYMGPRLCRIESRQI